ncbi:hypothetical protein ACFY12_10025 [Streptomyces sp. NPDC001339]|uniref:hypothetical protein n=1 Tax=Streptomyces sp. NPDC001339 TaxID=3364563 RepID=UPI003688518C
MEFARNVRSADTVAADEFRTTIIPRFGVAYANMHRGFWCDSRDLLRIHKRAAGLRVERPDGLLSYTLGAWRPPLGPRETVCTPLRIQFHEARRGGGRACTTSAGTKPA